MILGRIAILRASGFDKVVAEAAFASGWSSVDFYDDAFMVQISIDNLQIEGIFGNL